MLRCMRRAAPRITLRGKSRLIPMLISTCAFILAASFIAVILSRGNEQEGDQDNPAAENDLAALCGRLIGDEDAGVKVQAVLPIKVGCQDDTARYLISLSRGNPAFVSVSIHEMHSDDGRATMEKLGLKCATILVNGRSAFELPGGGKCLLEGPLNLNYTLEDLRAAIVMELESVYGRSAPAIPDPPRITTAPSKEARPL